MPPTGSRDTRIRVEVRCVTGQEQSRMDRARSHDGRILRLVARDTRLGRDVAVKVLPEAFARDAQRMARFEREARVLASLNDPNIASIYGLEESDSTRALVMELVEGQTLAQRIKQGPLPLDEALPYCQTNRRRAGIRA